MRSLALSLARPLARRRLRPKTNQCSDSTPTEPRKTPMGAIHADSRNKVPQYIYEVVLRDACACPSVCICDNRCQRIQAFKENLIKTPYSHEGPNSSATAAAPAAAFLSHLGADSLLQPPRRSIHDEETTTNKENLEGEKNKLHNGLHVPVCRMLHAPYE